MGKEEGIRELGKKETIEKEVLKCCQAVNQGKISL